MRIDNHLFVMTLCITIVASYLILALYFPKLYLLATYEDLVGEWLQFWLFVAATFSFSRLVLRPSRFRLFFAVLALGCFYVTMEEISWGQRILNLATPEFFQKHNIQKEMNLHNLLTGPVATLTKDLITYSLSAALALYGVLYPLAVTRQWGGSRPLVKVGIAPPPLFLWPFFACGSLLELGVFNFNETEVAEMLIAAALAIMGIYYLRLSRYDTKLDSLLTSPNPQNVRLAVPVCCLFLLAAVLSVVTTAVSYASEHNSVRIDNRLSNGIEKFAGRYKRYGHWQAAAGLYLHIHDSEPHRNSILRKLSECYRSMGDDDKFQHYIGKALSNDLARYPENPDSIALNQSLARTYRQLDQQDKAQYHLEKALRLGLAWVRKKPKSAKAAYWLGRTYKLRGEKSSAAAQFERAYHLEPSSLKYRQAFYNNATQ